MSVCRALSLYIVIALVILCTYAHADCYPDYDMCRVIRVIDGDTVVAECRFRGEVRIRLLNVDTCESRRSRHLYKQVKLWHLPEEVILECGKREKAYLQSLIEGKVVLVELGDRRYDWYNRLLGILYITSLNNSEWLNVNQLMLNFHNRLLSTITREDSR